MRVQLRHGDQTHLADLDVEQEVRHGRLFAEDELHYPPWTGPGFRKLGELPALADAFASPDARFAAWVRARRFPWGTLAAVGIVAAAGALQLAVTVAGALLPELSARVSRAVLRGAIGYEPLLLDGAWWTPWTSQLLHAGALHLLMNLPVLAYCGFRVERALGLGGFTVVGAAAVLGGTVAVTALGDLPVVGASILAYGFWGAQITIGFRVGEAMPPGWRGFYGWGNLVLFVPLFAASLGQEGVSDLGHLGGLAGGVLAAMLVPAESFRAAGEVAERRRANLRVATLLGALPMLAGPALARLMPAMALPAERVEVAEAGVTVELPWRMAENPVRFAGLPAWVVSRNHDEPVFCGLVRLREPRSPTAEDIGLAWAEAMRAHLEPVEPPPSLGSGWTSHAWVVREGAADRPTGRLVEHDLRRGVWLLRVGYHLPTDTDPDAGREALYRHVLATLEVSEPPSLAAARRQAALYPQDPERAWTLGRELADFGDVVAADDKWAELAARADGWRWEAVRGRVAAWAQAEAAGERGRLDRRITGPERVWWLTRTVAGAPAADRELQLAAVSWLAKDGACPVARAHADRIAAAADPALRDALDAALAACAPRAAEEPPSDATIGAQVPAGAAVPASGG